MQMDNVRTNEMGKILHRRFFLLPRDNLSNFYSIFNFFVLIDRVGLEYWSSEFGVIVYITCYTTTFLQRISRKISYLTSSEILDFWSNNLEVLPKRVFACLLEKPIPRVILRVILRGFKNQFRSVA